jgi:hypothetical protein
LTNNGDLALTGIDIAVSNGDFIAVNGCGTSLIGHATCAISVAYAPKQVGPETGTLTVNTALGAQTITLSGTGLAPPGISATPAIVNFGSQGVGATSAPPQPVTLTNNGGSTLTGLSFSVSGDYAIASNDCPVDHTLAQLKACHVNLVFTPTQAGERSGVLAVSAANLASPLGVALTGTGEDFQLQVSGPSSAVIVSGQTATYTVRVIPVDDSSGTLLLACAGAPQNSTCTINPSNLPITGGVTGFATVTVATGLSSTSSLTVTPWHGWQKMSMALAALLPFALSGRRRRSFLRAWLICFVTLALFLPAACGVNATGGSTPPPSGPPPPQGPTTPSGQYTLNITASTAGIQRSVSVTLTVQ